MKKYATLLLSLCLGCVLSATSQTLPTSAPWIADRGDGTYINPVLHADYSDPDVCRVGDDYWMTASSFNHTPGLPLLHSRDLVNWTLVGHALPALTPAADFAIPRHGAGVWAPCIRYHDGRFHIYWGDPDQGIFRVTADDPRGEWSAPELVLAGSGYIDPSPLWDDDGRVWMVFAWAGSRAGINSVLTVVELGPDGSRAISQPVMVYDGNTSQNHTVEGPKFHKRGEWYWIFAPAGGVADGWQLALRSRSVLGPYEARTVMARGGTDINGPHQGAWVETAADESWFINFQDMGAYGRVVHLNPMSWPGDDPCDWPVIGIDNDGDGCGVPVHTFRKPILDAEVPDTSPAYDEFDTSRLDLQWQWPANYHPTLGFPTSAGTFRLNAANLPPDAPNLWPIPNMLLRKFPAPEFTATTRIRLTAKGEGDRAGLIVMGLDYGAVQAVWRGGEFVVEMLTCFGAETGGAERTFELGRLAAAPGNFRRPSLAASADIWFRVDVTTGGECRFGFSPDGERFTYADETFTARPGKWVGAKVGLFAATPAPREHSWIDADWFRITAPDKSNSASTKEERQPEGTLVTYPAPEGASLNDDFEVRVRRPGGPWQPVSSYLVLVDEVRESGHTFERASMSLFDFDGPVEVAVTRRAGPIHTARVRPLSKGITPRVEGNTLTFTLTDPANLSVEVNGDIFHNLHLFAGPVQTDIPDPKATDMIWLGPGVHNPEGGRIEVPSGSTLYLAGGAVLKGGIVVADAENVKILGRGIIDHEVRMGIEISRSRNVLVEGLVTTQCATGGSDGVTIRNVKAISFFQWGDGMNVFASRNVLFDGVFCRNSDDCTTVYGTRKGFEGGCSNITMQHSTLWADVAHPIFIGIHGNADDPEYLEDLTYSDIDILDHCERQIDYQGCMAINAGDNNMIRRVRFENIRIEDFRRGQLVNMRIFYNTKYCQAPGRAIEDVLFRNITYNGSGEELSIIAGYDPDRRVSNIRFENLIINGTHIYDTMPGKPAWYKTSDISRFSIGEHTADITFD